MLNIKLDYELLNLETADPFGISYGTSSETKNVLVKLTYDDYHGLGEVAPVSYHGEDYYRALATLEHFKSINVLGDNPFAIVKIMEKMDSVISGHNSVKAGIEMALHDICGKILNKPLRTVLNLTDRPCPITDFTIGLDTLDTIERKTHAAVKAGYKILKIKQGTSYDKEIIKRVRSVTKDLPLRVDANGGWTVKEAINMAHFLSEHNVQFIEQPLPKYASVQDFSLVRQNSPLPIFADESICRANDVVRLGQALDGVVVKLAKTGGILEALKVIHTACAFNLKIMIGCMIESSIGVTAASQLASLVDYLDLDGALLLACDPYNGVEFINSQPSYKNLPGLGVLKKI